MMMKTNNKNVRNTKNSSSRTPMDAALRHLAYRARSVREMERHLASLQYEEEETRQTVERLQEMGYLNDTRFAEEFIRTRLNTKPVSRRKLYEQLSGHLIDRDCIEQALLVIDDGRERENALQIALKHAPQVAAAAPEERIPRLVRRLLGRGFTYEDAAWAAEKAWENDDA